MSAEVWHELCERAQAKGADLIQFEVNLGRALSGTQKGVGMVLSWCARAGKSVSTGASGQSPEDVTMLTRFGRTGEEALRSLVDGLEKGATK